MRKERAMNRAGWSVAAVLALAAPATDARVEGAGPGGFAASFEIGTASCRAGV